MRDSYSTQIFRVDGKNSFMEVLNVAFPIKKVQFNFVEYDPNQNNKQTKKLDIYMDAWLAASLAERILSGAFGDMVEKAKATGKFNGAAINPYTSFFTDMGGISEEKVARNFSSFKEKYPFLQQGQAISRQLKIQTGSKYPWVLRAEYGPGQSSEKGLIVPQGASPMFINLPVDADSFYKMAVAIKMSYQAYLNQYYMKYADRLFPSDEVKVFGSLEPESFGAHNNQPSQNHTSRQNNTQTAQRPQQPRQAVSYQAPPPPTEPPAQYTRNGQGSYYPSNGNGSYRK